MRKLLVALLLPLLFVGLAGPDPAVREAGAPPAGASPDSAARYLRVMSFNIRYDNPGDSLDAWPYRVDKVAGVIRFHHADLVGVQEALKGMLDDLQAALPAFGWFGVGRADGQQAGEYSAILYRKDRFEVLDHGTFWLSETPDVPGSKGWDAAIERIATWGRLRDRTTGRVFFHVNTHFDHVGVQAREESARLLRRRLGALAEDAPVVLTGDFNTEDTTAPYRILTTGAQPFADARDHSIHGHLGPNSTWNGFREIEPGRRIDFIFVRGLVTVLQHGILADQWDGGRFPSDHLPVLAEITLD